MSETFVQLAPDSTGKKMRSRDRVIGANTVLEQAIFNAGIDTYYALADNVAMTTTAKHHISIFNGVGSGRVIKVRKLFAINLQLAAITGVAFRFDVRKTTAQSSGTTITPVLVDSNNAALPAQILIATNATITNGSMLWPFPTNNDEIGATNAFPTTTLQQYLNLIPEGTEVQENTLREGQGMTAQQPTLTTAQGSWAWLMTFTVETP
jgi:hypothetical protein